MMTPPTMRKIPASLLVLFSSLSSFAGSSCPVDIARAARQPADPSAIEVEYKNVSGKEIVGVALGVDMYGNDGTMKALFFELRDREQLAPGIETKGAWPETMYESDFPHVNVFVKKVKFADATEWKDDGSGSCNSGLTGVIAKGTPSRIGSRQQPVTASAATASGHGEN